MYTLLAHLTFERKLDGKARASLGRQLYPLGAKLVRERSLKTMKARFDPNTAEWVFLTPDEKEEIVRRPLKGLDVQTLTGLEPSDSLPAPVVQLSLPFFDPRQGVRLLLDSQGTISPGFTLEAQCTWRAGQELDVRGLRFLAISGTISVRMEKQVQDVLRRMMSAGRGALYVKGSSPLGVGHGAATSV